MTGSPDSAQPDTGRSGIDRTRVDQRADRPGAGRPYVILSCAMSLDGRIDDCSPRRLILSNDADLDRVDEVRAGCDAILVGARTVRRDNPRLAVRSPQRRAARVAAGLPPSPLKVTLTRSASLDPAALFFGGDAAKVVYCAGAPGVADELRARLAGATAAGTVDVVDVAGMVAGMVAGTVAELTGRTGAAGPGGAGPDGTGPDSGGGVGSPADPVLAAVLTDLSRRGVRRLLVEGGTSVHTAFLTAGAVDELHLVIAPFFVGEADAPTFVGPGAYPYDAGHRLTLAEVRQIGDVVLLRYLTR